MYQNIDIDDDNGDGNISGYKVSSKDENYRIFLEENLNDENKINHIVSFIEKKGYTDITIILNLNVEKESRGQGIGKGLLETALENAQVALLISDKHESQIRSFVLNKFYENADFEKITNTSGGYLMCYPSNEGLQLKAHIKECEKNDKKKLKKMKI